MSRSADSVALMRLVVSSRELVFFEGEGHVRDLDSAGDLSRLLSSERKQRAEAAMQFSGSEQRSVRVYRSAVRSIGLGIVCVLFLLRFFLTLNLYVLLLLFVVSRGFSPAVAAVNYWQTDLCRLRGDTCSLSVQRVLRVFAVTHLAQGSAEPRAWGSSATASLPPGRLAERWSRERENLTSTNSSK